MADQEYVDSGTIVRNKQTGQLFKANPDGSYTPVPASAPQRSLVESAITGPAKAFGSGALHDFVPAVASVPSAFEGAAGAVKDWWAGQKPEDVAQRMPETKPEGVVTKPAADATSEPLFLNSEEIKKSITDVIPEYEPKNYAEKSLKLLGSEAPTALLAPEMWAARGMAKLLAGVRYGLAPAAASTLAGKASDALDVQDKYKPWLQTAAALAAPGISGRLITPYPVTADPAAAASRALMRERRVRIRPSGHQSTGEVDPALLKRDALNASRVGSDTSIGAQNAILRGDVTRGAIQQAYQGMADSPTLAPVYDQIRNARRAPEAIDTATRAIDNEFERLTSSFAMPISNNLQTRLQDIIDRFQYNNSSPVETISAMRTHVNNLINNSPQSPTGPVMHGRLYQNERSTMTNEADRLGGSAGRAFAQMREALDQEMRNTIQARAAQNLARPEDVLAFDRARALWQNNLIMSRAASNTGTAAEGNINPDYLAAAVRRTISPDGVEWMQHPMGQYAVAAQRHVKELPDVSAKEKFWDHAMLSGQLGAGAAVTPFLANAPAHSIAEMAGYALPVAAAAATGAAKLPASWAVHSDLLRPLIFNELLPKSARGMRPNASAESALAASMLAKPKKSDKPPAQ